ncbi:Hsp20 family protein [Blochmannia endosymbiont of Polyrhachis (Hedomyrma) turneri]|uniref:Hsp20 family protein n=1 Tax=Blochmannia endosymbiont of Polyrhachis (Hedomyrma) turneri TaxID=1505596 RepID=UPI00061A76D3|nr:Hsp20 family protein [Blochmannia endosymbiont of Polyrhachis (Hedomyrma) turneri]AKC59615.1 small heat shock protein ibpB [Blochmannia endosymbiont of Polyrhachis (Hedomyrma) turneri]
MRDYDFSPLFRQWIGFDQLANDMQEEKGGLSFPLYNIAKSSDNQYRITLALAGFKQEDLIIELQGTRLTISGRPNMDGEDQIKEYLHQGIISKEFSLEFTLAENMVVKHARFGNGLLNIDLERHLPESMKPCRISID